MKEKLIVFLRAPRPGQVKTRLAKEIGDQAALHAYKTLLDRLLSSLQSLQEVELRFTPDTARAEFEAWLRSGWHLAPQGTGNLGERLSRAFEQSFTASTQRIAIIGSDCPAITVDDIESAWHFLLSHDVVLGPAKDGGYWLIGLSEPHPELFQNIPWSTSAVLETTLARVRAAGLKFKCLRTLADIDTVEDWNDYNRS